MLSAKHDGLTVPPRADTHLWSVWPGNPSAAPRHQRWSGGTSRFPWRSAALGSYCHTVAPVWPLCRCPRQTPPDGHMHTPGAARSQTRWRSVKAAAERCRGWEMGCGKVDKLTSLSTLSWDHFCKFLLSHECPEVWGSGFKQLGFVFFFLNSVKQGLV